MIEYISVGWEEDGPVSLWEHSNTFYHAGRYVFQNDSSSGSVIQPRKFIILCMKGVNPFPWLMLRTSGKAFPSLSQISPLQVCSSCRRILGV